MQMPALTMPASFAAIDEEEMTYTTGGCFISGAIAGSIADWLLARGATRNLGTEKLVMGISGACLPFVVTGEYYSYDGERFYDPQLGDDSYVYYDGDSYWAGSKSSLCYKLGSPLKDYSNRVYMLRAVLQLGVSIGQLARTL